MPTSASELDPTEDATPVTVEHARAGLDSQVALARAQQCLVGRASIPCCVGRYRVVQRLGGGGMGLVFAAVDEQLDRMVAVKILRREVASILDGSGSLLREAQSMARLSHPNVGQVYDVGDHDGELFIAMEMIRGQTLRKWYEARRRSRAEIVGMFIRAGRGLAAAHAAGLVHSDFKPDNVLVGEDGRPRVVDFGLAQPSSNVGTDHGHDKGRARSGDRTIAGTMAYMAPEQKQGGGIDARADQFAFCVSLFEALHGRRPFDGPIRHDPRVDHRAQEVPRGLNTAILRGLAADPEKRFANMNDLLESLSAYASGPSGRAPRLLIAGSFALLGVLGWVTRLFEAGV